MRRALGRPAAAVNDEAWRDDAACRSDVTVISPEDWFLNNEDAALRAKAICAGCPVQDPCLAYALRTGQPWGVWGGKTSDERGTAYAASTARAAARLARKSDPDRPQSRPEQGCPLPSPADTGSSP